MKHQMCSRVAGCLDILKAKDANTCGAFYFKEVRHFLCTSNEVLMSFRISCSCQVLQV